MACESEKPVSTSWRTAMIVRASFGDSVWSSRTYSARNSDRPAETIVAIWRAMTVRSREPTGVYRSRMSCRVKAMRLREISTTVKPRPRSCAATWVADSPCTSPWVGAPLGSMPLKV